MNESQNRKIKGGATIWARQTIDSDVFFWRPDKWFKIWFYIVNHVNHKDTKLFKRGENFTTYADISEYTKATKDQIDGFIRYSKEQSMLTTQKTTRGMIIKVLNYDLYQDLDNYKNDTQNETKTKHKRNTNDTINKNDKNDNNTYSETKVSQNLVNGENTETPLQSEYEDENGNPVIPPKNFKKLRKFNSNITFNFDSELENLRASKILTDKIVAYYWRAKNFHFSNWYQWQVNYEKDKHFAKQLKGYAEDDKGNISTCNLKKIAEECIKESKELNYDWTIATMVKKAANLINK